MPYIPLLKQVGFTAFDHNFTCDIDKFEPRELPFNQEKERCAKEHGWTFLKTEDEIDYYTKS